MTPGIQDGDQADISEHNQAGERQVQHRTGDDQADVEELVAEDRDGDRQRDQRDTHDAQSAEAGQNQARHARQDDQQRQDRPEQLPAHLFGAASVPDDQTCKRRPEHDHAEDARRRAEYAGEPVQPRNRRIRSVPRDGRQLTRRFRERQREDRAERDSGIHRPSPARARRPAVRKQQEYSRQEESDRPGPGIRGDGSDYRPPARRRQAQGRIAAGARRIAQTAGEQQPSDRVSWPAPRDRPARDGQRETDARVADHIRVRQRANRGPPRRPGRPSR